MTAGRKLGVVTPSYSRFIPSNPVLVAKGLTELGHEVELITTRGLDARVAPYQGVRMNNGTLPVTARYAPYFGSLLETVITAGPPDDLPARYDALLLQEDYPVLCHQMARWARKRNIPWMLSSERYYYPPAFAPRAALRVFDRTVNRAIWFDSRVITTHSTASRKFLTDEGAPADRFEFVPASIDALTFRKLASEATATPRPDGPATIICVARLHPYKGLETLLRAMVRLRDQRVPVRLRIHGRGPLETELRSQIRRLGLEGTSEIGWSPVPNLSIPALLLGAQIYVQPSLLEPFGISVVEAMSCGLPVVASATGGMLDTVVPGRTGLLVPPGDVDALATAIRTLVEDPERARAMGDHGRERAVELFDYRSVARTYETLIDRMLE